MSAIAELAEERVVEGVYAVARKRRLRTRGGAPYLALELVDASGRIEARVWHDVELLDPRFDEGDAVRVLGRVERFRDRLQVDVRTLEAAIIATASRFGVEAERVAGLTGVWVDGARKLAAIGVRVRRGVTTHGLALNVNTDLRWFAEMVPCGIRDKDVTSLERELGHRLEMEAVEEALADELATHLGLRLASGMPGVVGPGGAAEQ